MHEGAFDYMMKPIDIDALLGKLSEAVKAAEAAGLGGGRA